MNIEEYLEQEQLKRIVENTVNLQKKVFLRCLYEKKGQIR
jgi:hypothetical protein